MTRKRARRQVWKYADGKLSAERQRIASAAAKWREEEEARAAAAYAEARQLADARLAKLMDTTGTRYG